MNRRPEKNNKRPRADDPVYQYLGLGLAVGTGFGLCLGIVVGAYFDNPGVGLSLGMSLGASLGLSVGLFAGYTANKRDKSNKDSNS